MTSGLRAFALTVALLLVPAAAAVAGDLQGPVGGSYPGHGTSPAPADPGGGVAQSAPDVPVSAQVRTCSLFAGDGSYGMSCRGSTEDGLTYAQILGGDEVPGCWDEPVPADFGEPGYTGDQLRPDGTPRPGTWYLQTCLSGIDPDTKDPSGPLRFTQSAVYVLAPAGPRTLTQNQQTLVDGAPGRRGQIPPPFVQTSPSQTPRVGQDVAFSVPASGRTGPTITVSGPGIGTVSMRSRMVEVVVWPQGTTPAPSVSCPGGGQQVVAGDTRAGVPGACWWSWDRSSADRDGGEYVMPVEGRWVVEYEAGAGWVQLGTFTSRQSVGQRVTEVQTLVVP